MRLVANAHRASSRTVEAWTCQPVGFPLPTPRSPKSSGTAPNLAPDVPRVTRENPCLVRVARSENPNGTAVSEARCVRRVQLENGDGDARTAIYVSVTWTV